MPATLEADAMRRLKEAVRKRGGAQKVADITDIPIGTLTKNLSGQTKAAFGTIMAVIEALEIDPSTIFPPRVVPKKTIDIINESAQRFRAGQARRVAATAHLGRIDDVGNPNAPAPPNIATPAMIRLPVYGDVRAAAGRSAIPASEMSDGVISFDPRFLRDQGAVPERCTVIWAHGDSMVPTIPDGSALIVDHSQTEVKNGSIMVIGVGDDLLVKRVRRRLDGLIDLISDNTAYASETLGPDSLRQLRVIGRVVYFCRTP